MSELPRIEHNRTFCPGLNAHNGDKIAGSSHVCHLSIWFSFSGRGKLNEDNRTVKLHASCSIMSGGFDKKYTALASILGKHFFIDWSKSDASVQVSMSASHFGVYTNSASHQTPGPGQLSGTNCPGKGEGRGGGGGTTKLKEFGRNGGDP